jgi:exopolyphosphatase/guanosine-5'-triphosphate,3'-diphosphate pyrophosphatase
MTRLAAIDVGTNSVRTTVVEVNDGEPYRLVDEEKEYTRLGEGRGSDGSLADDAMERTTAALRRMCDLALRLQAETIVGVATAAVRDAPNGREWVNTVREQVGLELRVLSGEEEARLAFLAAAESFPLQGRSAVVDVGGGSVEVVAATGRQIESVMSVPFGALSLAERFGGEDPMSESTYADLRRHVRRGLRDAVPKGGPPVSTLVASGGTVNALASMVAARTGSGGTSVHGFELAARDVNHLLAMLRRSTQRERLRVPGLPPGRADIITPGAVIVAEVMRAFDANSLWVNAKGIREGLIIEHVRGGSTAKVTDPIAAAERFAERCNWEEAHSRAVAALADSLFSQLSGPLGIDPSLRTLLRIAALLHDVGYFISYERHHKHSFHLIIHTSLPGLSRRELAIVAAVARYHSGALPKARHEELAAIDRPDRRIAEQLASLLRLADGLDRTRDQQVSGVIATLEAGVVRLEVNGTGPLDVIIHGAREKADLLERTFHVRVDIEPGKGD